MAEGVAKCISQLTIANRKILGNKRTSTCLVVDFGRDRHIQGVHWKDTLTANSLGLLGCLLPRTYLI